MAVNLKRKNPTFFIFQTAMLPSHVCWCVSLIPGAMPGNTMEDVVTARADYTKLDQPSSPIRIRLNCTVVRVTTCWTIQNQPKEVEVSLHARRQDASAFTARLRPGLLQHDDSVLVSGNARKAKGRRCLIGVKVPYLYTHVVIRNWTAVQRSRNSSHRCARELSHVCGARFPSVDWQISIPEQS